MVMLRGSLPIGRACLFLATCIVLGIAGGKLYKIVYFSDNNNLSVEDPDSVAPPGSIASPGSIAPPVSQSKVEPKVEPKVELKDLRRSMKAFAHNWTLPKLPEHLKNADQTNPELIQHIREHWIIPPTGEPLNVINKNPKGDDNQGQEGVIDKVLKQKRNGFFVECGAADGEYGSHSVFFEIHRNWTGLLIEANPTFFAKVLAKKRNVYAMNACVSPKKTPMEVQFSLDDIAGGIVDFIPDTQKRNRGTNSKKKVTVQCFPYFSIMSALGKPHVNFFSLDIEGAEVEVLETIPFDVMEIDTFTIEKRIENDKAATDKKAKRIEDLLKPVGYKTVHLIHLDIMLSKV